jgi:apolipoprotein N-acyltransferase
MKHLQLGLTLREGVLTLGVASLSILSFPPFGLWPLSLPAICLFLLLLRDRDSAKARSLGLLYGLAYGLGTMYWFFNIFSVLAIPLIAIFAAYFGILASLVSLSKDHRPLVRAALVGLFAAGIEWLRGDAWYLRFPWYTVPHALAQDPIWIAPVRWLGAYGFSFALWFIAGLGAFAHYRYWALFALLPASALLLPEFPSPDQKALLLQSEQMGGADNLIRKEALGSKTKIDLVVLPEYAYRSAPAQVLASRYGPAKLARKYRCPVVFGATEERADRTNYYNVAAVTDAEGNLLGTFAKQHPVPLFRDGIPGDSRPVFPVAGGVLGVAVCYDFDAPEIAATLVRRGATVLVDPTFDAMSWGRIQHEHHELLLRLRAVENDRWVLRCASSGRSEAVDPHGFPSAAGVAIGPAGSVVVDYAHAEEGSYPLGGQLHILGPLAAAGCLGYLILFWARRRALRKPGRSNEPST